MENTTTTINNNRKHVSIFAVHYYMREKNYMTVSYIIGHSIYWESCPVMPHSGLFLLLCSLDWIISR